jgi:hypothetical protein
MKAILFTIFLSPLLLLAQGASNSKTAQDKQVAAGSRPDFARMQFADIKWRKADGKAFWFYYKPTMYFFKADEYTTIPMENGDIVVYIPDYNKYLLLPGFSDAEKNEEFDTELAADKSCILVRTSRGHTWIFDKGVYVQNLERIGYSNTVHEYVYHSAVTDKRYLIAEKDLLYGPISTAIGISSE